SEGDRGGGQGREGGEDRDRRAAAGADQCDDQVPAGYGAALPQDPADGGAGARGDAVLALTRATCAAAATASPQGNRIWESRGRLPPPLTLPTRGGDLDLAPLGAGFDDLSRKTTTASPSPLWGGSGVGVSSICDCPARPRTLVLCGPPQRA